MLEQYQLAALIVLNNPLSLALGLLCFYFFRRTYMSKTNIFAINTFDATAMKNYDYLLLLC